MSKIIEHALDTIRIEARSIERLAQLITPDFELAVRAILDCKGKVIVTGMGKSGIIGRKIAATLASTGTPAFFLHPGEAYHGDLGMVEPKDIIVAITNSGQTDEVLRLVPFFKDQGNIIIAITGNPESLLAKNSTYHLNVAVESEACPMNLAPTSSTTAVLVMGDALAVALIREREFKQEDFAALHPGGRLGRQLLMKVGEVTKRELPRVGEDEVLADVIIAISEARVGIATVVDSKQKLLGVITDGDIRRAMARYKSDFFAIKARDIMSKNPKTIAATELVSVAEQIMVKNKIHSLIVTDKDGVVVGVVEYFSLA